MSALFWVTGRMFGITPMIAATSLGFTLGALKLLVVGGKARPG